MKIARQVDEISLTWRFCFMDLKTRQGGSSKLRDVHLAIW